MQTVSWAGSTYDIPNQRGDTPWSGLSDFAIAVAAKGINTGGGNFTLLADLNFGATFGLVSTYYKSRSANIASAGQVRLARADVVSWRNQANGANLDLSVNTSNQLLFNGVLLATAAAALTASRALVSDSSGNITVATTTSTEIGYVNGVTSAIQTQINAKAPSASPTFTGTVTIPISAGKALISDGSSQLAASATTSTELAFVNGVTSAIQTQLNARVTSVTGTANQITSTGGTTPVLALASPLTTPGAVTVTGSITFSPTTAGLVGTTTNNDAATGNVGQYTSANDAGINFGGTGVYTDITSISLTAGDWDVTGIIQLNRAGAVLTSTVFIGGVSSTSGNSATGLVTGLTSCQQSIGAGDVTFNSISVTIPRARFSLSGTTTIYLKGFVDNVSSGTPTFSGGLTARRIR